MPPCPPDARPQRRDALNRRSAAARHVLLYLLALRLLNALTIRTFFQPDEFFQALEPAWQLAFGRASGACITWEWKHQLRSSMHPALFAAVLQGVAALADGAALPLALRADLLIAAPKITQAVAAALADYCAWKLAERLYGRGSAPAWATLALTAGSPWQWFCSTRTLSNCLETTLTAAALCLWPWHWLLTPAKQTDVARDRVSALNKLRLALTLAAFACVLRPTNALIWICVAVPALVRAAPPERHALVREAVLCGSAVLALSAASDRLYYGEWAFPPLRFVHFNVAKDLAVFYGRNRPDYYLTEGLPLLLTTALPCALVGLVRAFLPRAATAIRQHPKPDTNPSPSSSPGTTTTTAEGSSDSDAQAPPPPPPHLPSALSLLASTVLVFTATLSLIAHKEVRFLYPLLPILHVLAAEPLSAFALLATRSRAKKVLLLAALAVNVVLAAYAGFVHQRGVLDVLGFLRGAHEGAVSRSSENYTSGPEASSSDGVVSTAAFLMPCHSTPWRSHLVHPGISAWALSCEPPIDVPLALRAEYMDEADLFYADPAGWVRAEMEDVAIVSAAGAEGKEGVSAASSSTGKTAGERREGAAELEARDDGQERRPWPQYLIFFAQLEGAMGSVLGGSRYRECWRGFNSHFHDDWRRRGDVVVWCLGDE